MPIFKFVLTKSKFYQNGRCDDCLSVEMMTQEEKCSNVLTMQKKDFLTSRELMEAVRALDYKAQYKVCEAFYKLSKGFDWSDRLMFQRFEKSFTMIDAENLEEHFVELHWAVNDMDNFLYETDVYSPEEFYMVVREMEGVIDGLNTNSTNNKEG